jgi:SAM-dependent methyltransferase
MLNRIRSLPVVRRFFPGSCKKGYALKGLGIEIGAHRLPVPGISPVYIDRFVEFAGEPCLVDVVSDAIHLPFPPGSLDYIVSSHLIEHLPNPLLALQEWHSLLKKGGVLYMVVPDARFTFDHMRERTSLEHLVEDYERGCNECDPTHIDEFTEKVDISRMNAGLSHEEARRLRVNCNLHFHDMVASGMGINIHFHVFEPYNFMAMMDYSRLGAGLSWESLEMKERFPPDRKDGFLAVFRKTR